MANRLKGLFDEPEEPRLPGDWFALLTRSGHLLVDRSVAAYVAAQLDRTFRRRWLRFEDIFGSAIRIRTRDVLGMFECTKDQRASERRFARERRVEEREDRVPGEDDEP